jgi:hypothetical protein
MSKAGAYPSEATHETQVLSYPRPQILDLDEGTSLQFWGLYYKTFYGHNLRFFVVSCLSLASISILV